MRTNVLVHKWQSVVNIRASCQLAVQTVTCHCQVLVVTGARTYLQHRWTRCSRACAVAFAVVKSRYIVNYLHLHLHTYTGTTNSTTTSSANTVVKRV